MDAVAVEALPKSNYEGSMGLRPKTAEKLLRRAKGAKVGSYEASLAIAAGTKET